MGRVETIGMEKLEGTRTLENLQHAFDAEATSSMRYKIYAEQSDDAMVKKTLRTIASNETEHAEVISEMLGALGTDEENLGKCVALESFTAKIDYPEIARIAEEEGFPYIAEKFRLIAEIEKHHMEMFTGLLNDVKNGTLYKRQRKSFWHCTECGYIVEALEAPEKCPVCGHGRDDFELL